MNKLLLAVLLSATTGSAGLAGTIEQQLLAALRDQGYVVVEQSYTFLGRLRVIAKNGDSLREIVVNPGTGEVLRDLSVMTGSSDSADPNPARTSPEVAEPLPVEVNEAEVAADAVETTPGPAPALTQTPPEPEVEDPGVASDTLPDARDPFPDGDGPAGLKPSYAMPSAAGEDP